MTQFLRRWLESIWYRGAFPGILLLPLAAIFSTIVRARFWCYQNGWLKRYKLPVPVIVVGNITVGGTGKTPLVIWLAQFLTDKGYHPGIISRGYGGNAGLWPQAVTATSNAQQVGDEPVLIAKRTQVPVMVSPLRVEAAKQLLTEYRCDVIISDDGLQHYKLQRDIEILIIDGTRRFGNGFCLPAGPLREAPDRSQSVDMVVVNGAKYADNGYEMKLTGDFAVNLATGEQKPLSGFVKGECYAVAGIGNPERFFKFLMDKGLKCATKSFPDHYLFKPVDLLFEADNPVLMTEKDAVKCSTFAGQNHWFVPIQAELEPGFGEKLLNLLVKKT